MAKVPVPLDVHVVPALLAALDPVVIFTAPLLEHVAIAVPAVAVGAIVTVTLAVLFELMLLVHNPPVIPELIPVTVIVVAVALAVKDEVVKVPVPGLPAVKVIVAVFPVADVPPVRL